MDSHSSSCYGKKEGCLSHLCSAMPCIDSHSSSSYVNKEGRLSFALECHAGTKAFSDSFLISKGIAMLVFIF
jgi:hypothetical protein